jgi:hypothetical protein
MDGHRGIRVVLVIILAFFAFFMVVEFAGWCYASLQVAHARSHGFYPTAEEAMRQFLEKNYIDITRIDILSAGPNSFDGSNPHVWYVIAEVRASRRADGFDFGENGCYAPGLFFLQTHEGWFYVPEGAFPVLLGHWMSDFGLAGPGQSTPSVRFANRPTDKICQSP